MRIKYVTVGNILGPVITEQETSFLVYLIICRLGSDIFMSFSSPTSLELPLFSVSQDVPRGRSY